MKNNFDEEQRAILILMALFKSTAFSKMQKSFGNLTTCRVKGMNIVKEKVDEVTNPNTLKQQKQRKRFPTLMELAGALPEALSLGLAKRPQNNTPENYFMHLNRKAVEVTDELEKTVDYERLVLSQGNRMLPVRMSVTKDTEAGTLTFTIPQTNFKQHAAPDDVFYGVVLEKGWLQSECVELGKRSEDVAYTWTMPEEWSMDELEVYVFVTSADGKKASKTRHLKVS